LPCIAIATAFCAAASSIPTPFSAMTAFAASPSLSVCTPSIRIFAIPAIVDSSAAPVSS